MRCTEPESALWMTEISALSHAQALPATIHGPSAVDDKRVTVDEAAFLRIGEEQNGVGDIRRGGKAAHGVYAFNVGIVVAAASLVRNVHFRFHPAGADSIHANTATAPFCRKRTGESDEAVLG